MVITWNSATLCHGPERGVGKATGAADLQIDEPPTVQVVPRIRTPEPAVYDRGNRPAIVTFTTVEEYASLAAALLAYGTQARALDRSGTLTLNPGGGTSLRALNAVLAVEGRRLSGVAITWRYRITCPKLETVATP
jgi:hypothetical protein